MEHYCGCATKAFQWFILFTGFCLIYTPIVLEGKKMIKMTSKNFMCASGDKFKLDCRFCICDPGANNYILCEKKHCRKKPPCTPFTKTHVNCSFCTCLKSGLQFCMLGVCQWRTSSYPSFCMKRGCEEKEQGKVNLDFHRVHHKKKRKHRQCRP